VATFLGALLALDARVGLIACATWLVVAAAFRYSSLASICSAVAAPPALLWLAGSPAPAAVVAAMSALLVLRHRANLASLVAGKERRIGEKAARG
jgi:glycerol-3-phosphate acyltransferase PlsY